STTFPFAPDKASPAASPKITPARAPPHHGLPAPTEPAERIAPKNSTEHPQQRTVRNRGTGFLPRSLPSPPFFVVPTRADRRDTKFPPPLSHGPDRATDPQGNLLVGHRPEQGVLLGREGSRGPTSVIRRHASGGFEERHQRDAERCRQPEGGQQRNVRLAGLDALHGRNFQAGPLGECLPGHTRLLPHLTETRTEPLPELCGAGQRIRQGRLRRPARRSGRQAQRLAEPADPGEGGTEVMSDGQLALALH